ncbi:AI-2E family transporter [Methylocapsa aurea]|uniref:AI-2E family transporter n=1 Tax=Methylocapsa aurea TaxID=663610 RepID=UPI0006898AA1|nr:AI-2E family transporter [Methylocapsa aurea]
MTDFFESPAARPQKQPDSARTLEMLATLFLVAFVVMTLYVGREIFVPIAIAILLSFVLSPPILVLRRWGLGRVPSVVTVVLAALVVAFAVSAVLTRQVSELAVDLPKYQATVNEKIGRLRDAAADNVLFAKVSAAVKSFGEIIPNRSAPANGPAPSGPRENRLTQSQSQVQKDGHAGNEASERPIPVEVHQPAPGPFDLLQTIAGTALSPLETTFIVIVFVVFILLQREDLRNRFLRLVGSGDLQRTTLAMTDAAGRLSRFFLIQTLINACFGVIVAIGLYFIGVPSPILWGIVAALLRFVPYIGSFIAAGFPIVLAAAVDPGWTMALETLALFVIIEPIIGQAVEPWLYGRHTGLSPIAVVISATFWTWLWGAVGLVLSTPLTVCLVVLGRHVERLAFLDVIFGDAPPLTPVENFYQRMLVGDASEVADQAERYLKTHSLVDYFDDVALAALLMAQTDLRRGVLDEAGQLRIRDTIEEVVEDLSDHVDQPPTRAAAPEPAGTGAPASAQGPLAMPPTHVIPAADIGGPLASEQDRPTTVLCIAGRSFLDEAAAALFADILKKQGIAAKVESAQALTIGRIADLSPEGAELVCLSFFDADLSAARARFAVRRLRRRLKDVTILAGFWRSDAKEANDLCAEIRADFCATTFKDALGFCQQQAAAGERTGESGPTDAKPAALGLAGAA